MKKRKINQQYLRSITAFGIKEEPIDALDLALSVKEFADEYLRGIMTVDLSGTSRGNVRLNLPVVTYLVRLLCEIAADDTMVRTEISLGEKLVITAHFEALVEVEEVAHMVSVARLAGFKVARERNVFTYTCDVYSTFVMKVYATSALDFKEMLITTFKM